MNAQRHRDTSAVAKLPPYRAILVVDMKDFSGSAGRDHAQLTEAIPDILRQAFDRCGLAELWNQVRFQGSTGDGYFLGFRSAVLPYLFNPFLLALQEELDYRNEVRSVSGQDRLIRMRVSINVGPMTDSGENRMSDGSGDSRIETHRLLDSDPVRDLLTRSSAITCVAAIVSARAFEDAVLSGFANDDPALYVEAPVRVKTYEGTAYLRVPRPSGDLLAHGFRPSNSDDAPEVGKQNPQPTGHANTMHGVHGSAVQARDYTNRQRGGIGTITGNVGTVVTDVRGPVNTGSGKQFNAPQFTGDSVNYMAGDNEGITNERPGTSRRRKDHKR